MTTIETVTLRSILDSRGNPTIEADIWVDGGFGRAAAPSGASTGTHEAVVRAPEEAIPFAYTTVIPELIGLDSHDQRSFDRILRECDGTGNFGSIGANVAVALSLANAKAAASAYSMELFTYLGGVFAEEAPLPLGNVIGGGAHAPGATEIQEFLVIPIGASSTKEAVFTNALVHKEVKKLLTAKGITCGKGDEGAWAPQISDTEALDLIGTAIDTVCDETGVTVAIGLDVAATELWDGERYIYRERSRTTDDQITYITDLVDAYGLVYVEDPLHEEDFEGFSNLTDQVNDNCLICGDDLFVTNPERIQSGIEYASASAVLIKPNQIGTLTDTFEAVHLAERFGLETVMSHRSGETTDVTIAHLAVAFGCIYLKCGIVGGERIAKLNELIRISENFA
ncbi:MAG: Enolase [Methanomicrobiales archaeon 53_19]|jgi:enolase|uniref:phosphopyruvate hydratase n=1 Tax=Methanocalculus sp. TaxID=2004547 RepID=UPI0007496968|nr:phosphopyruvate hydratase [Methanocalculus sp.]KUK69201.1 MAG: Enolase [Methanocalculus sp. 52_23]KUL02921.1 MAG: Enolase [Methanomicrobiales archaeon 53_19]HIJ07160.1 phosphopyruvate hydratase [Methanocalculus sp.]